MSTHTDPTVHDDAPARLAAPRRRGIAELSAVALLAAVLGSGGTLAATSLAEDDGTAEPVVSTATADTSSGSTGATTTPASSSTAAGAWTATAAKVTPSVVSVMVRTATSQGEGSGVVIDDDGHVVTNNHVVAGATGNGVTVVLSDGRSYPATIAGTDPSTDLAVLTITNAPKDLTPIEVGSSTDLAVGDDVMAVGNPLGLASTVTTGIVSALNRPVSTGGARQDPFGGSVQSTAVVTNAIQTSAAINPGNSGGALVDARGRLVGINSSIATLSGGGSRQSGNIGIGFAIPVDEAKMIAEQLIKDGKAVHAYLGVNVGDGTAKVGGAGRQGAEVTRVEPNTPAADAGLRSGDLVVAFDGQRVESAESLIGHVRGRAAGTKVTLQVIRDGKQQDVTVALGSR